MKSIILLIGLIVFLSCYIGQVSAQETVSGKVTDESGEPLIGTTITIQGTARGVMCDIQGEYRIEVNRGEKLIFSFIGFIKQEIVYTGINPLNVVMKEDVPILSDHPVFIYTPAQKKKDISTGVVKTITYSYDRRATGMTNTEEYMNGLVAGMFIRRMNDDFSVLPGIRSGIGNIGGETKYVVDGIPDAPVNFADIMSVEVIKGIPSQPVYGTLTASGGVLNIQTGLREEKFIANAWAGIRSAATLLPAGDKEGYDEYLRTGFVQHYDIKFADHLFRNSRSLKISGSVVYDKMNGTFRGSGGQRFTPRLTLDYRAQKWLKLLQTVYFDRREQDYVLFREDREEEKEALEMEQVKTNPRNEIFSASEILIQPFRWLDIKSVFTYDWVDNKGEQTAGNNPYSDYRDYLDYRNRPDTRSRRWLWDTGISSSHFINSDHNLLFLAGFTRDGINPENSKRKLFSNNLPEGAFTDNMLLRGAYNYAWGVRTFSASIRRMTSSLPDKDNKEVVLPTLSAGWVFSRERFMDLTDFLSSGKIKAGWGKTAHISLLAPVMQEGTDELPLVFSDLKWQITEQAEVGTELYFLDNKWALSADYYYKTTDHLLENRGFSSEGIHIASGSMEVVNKGWEFSSSFANYYSNTTWEIGANFTRNYSSVRKSAGCNQPVYDNYKLPDYYYGIRGHVIRGKITLSAVLQGAAGMQLPDGMTVEDPFMQSSVKVNYFSLKSLSVIYSLPLRSINRHSRIDLYAHAENLFFKANSSQKKLSFGHRIPYPVDRMFSMGFKIFL